MRKVIILTAICALVISMATPLLALDQTGRLGLGYRFGLHSVMKDPWSAKFLHGAELKWGMCPHVSIGLTGTYARTDGAKLVLDGALPTFEAYDKDTEESLFLRNYIIEVGPIFNLMPDGDANVYVTTGIGLGSWTIKDADGKTVRVDDNNGNSFALDDQQLTLMIGAGLEYFLIEEFSIGVAGRYHFYTKVGSAFNEDSKKGLEESDALDLPTGLIEGAVVATAYFGKCKDDDKDDVCNDDDNCPETPAGCLVDEFGCPIDSDGDGVCDGIDQCPDTPKGCKVDLNGCPIDSDVDGVCDGVDRCPGTQTGCKVDQWGCAIDTDKDGVPDCRDKCPGTPTCCKVDANGCELDSDNDGVCDGCDKCPGTPPGYEVDAAGCPTGYMIEKEMVLTDVTFVTNSSVLAKKAKKTLDGIAENLKALPHVKLYIDGHTDNTGGKEWNQKLSENRAQAVADHLISLGLDKSRFTVRGFGMDKPKADNKTVKGRNENRRVEMNRMN